MRTSPRHRRVAARTLFLLLIAISGSLFTGCSVDAARERMAAAEPQAEGMIARDFLDSLQRDQLDHAASLGAGSITTPQGRHAMEQAAAAFPQDRLIELKLTGLEKHVVNDRGTAALTYEYHFEQSGWWLGQVVMATHLGNDEVIGFHFGRIRDSLENLGAFGSAPLDVLHLVMLGLMVGIPLFVLATFVVAVRTRMPRRALWCVAVLLGVSQLQFDWATGALRLGRFFSVNILSAAFHKEPYGPWVFTLGVPLGALVFWIQRRRFLAAQASSTPGSEAAPPAAPR